MKKSIPRLQCKINLNQREINYTLKFSQKAKYLRLQINNSNELEVVLPRRYKHDKAEDFILKKKDWILKHLKEKKNNKYFFLGKEITVILNYDLFLKKPHINYKNKILVVSIPSGYKLGKDETYNFWLKHKAKTYLSQRVRDLSLQTGLYFNKITIRSQKTRWGSCSTGRRLSFNYKLMRYRKKVIDYVIIHELCHLKEMNHSERFWKLVEEYCPDYKILKRELKATLK